LFDHPISILALDQELPYFNQLKKDSVLLLDVISAETGQVVQYVVRQAGSQYYCLLGDETAAADLVACSTWEKAKDMAAERRLAHLATLQPCYRACPLALKPE
jgi:hypothetical protein